MGQAKERKARLGSWYGKPIGPGHPDFVPPKTREPKKDPMVDEELEERIQKAIVDPIDGRETKSLVRRRPVPSSQTTREEPIASEPTEAPFVDESPREESSEKPRRVVSIADRRTRPLLFVALAMTALSSGMCLGPEPEYRPKKR